MDNKITKRRLSDFLAYEWILMIIIAVIAMVAWELVYTIGSVRLTVGQEFKMYYDQNVNGAGMSKLYDLVDDKLSYDVLQFSTEGLDSSYNVLSIRLSIQEGDVIITDNKEAAEEATDKSIRAKTIVDQMNGYSYEKMLNDAKTYLRDNFLKDSEKTVDDYNANPTADLDLATNYDKLDESKIEARFRLRMVKDNRFRTVKQIEQGIEKEKARIENLCKEVQDFEKLLNAESQHPELFFRYTKYAQTVDLATTDKEKEIYEPLLEKQKEEIYGLNVSALKDYNPNEGEEKTNPTEYFTLVGSDGKADNLVIMAFDFWKYQYDLQFETITFINAIVRQCSDILG